NVVACMKSTHAVIGGEGNGGIIYPELHYGRDALVGIALFLSHYAEKKMTMTALRKAYPSYTMTKRKIELDQEMDVDAILSRVQSVFRDEETNTVDGLKIDFADGWVHLRKSNTEPIIRIYSEGASAETAERLSDIVMREIQQSV
ncbi:MAG: phosphoglucosamine mutase, partial [Flavobacteriales bacterium]